MKAAIREAIKTQPAHGTGWKPPKPKLTPGKDARGRWLKGVSGNSLGRPRSALSELCRQQITKHGLVAVLGSIAARTGDYGAKTKIPITVADQINAIKLLLLYGFGQPKGEIDAGDNVRIEVTYDNRNQIAITNAAHGAGEDHTGIQTFQRPLLRQAIRQDDAGDGSLDSPGAAG